MQNVGEEIWQIVGSQPGPSLLILGGIHGNEGAGVAVVRSLKESFEAGKLSLLAGTLTLGIGNLKAVEDNVRFIEGRDLNRYFTDRNLAGHDGSEEEKRAIELAAFIRSADITIDVHSTNKPSTVFVCTKDDPAHEKIYRRFAPEVVLTDPKYILGGEPATTDEYADRVGKIGICVEAGDVNDISAVPKIIKNVETVMGDLGMLAVDTHGDPEKPKHIYELTEAILLGEDGFRWAEGKGSRSFEPVDQNEIIGYRGDEPIVSKEKGVIVFPKMLEHQKVGKPVGYLAKEVL
jgi:succinylglutamate desuccinylase